MLRLSAAFAAGTPRSRRPPAQAGKASTPRSLSAAAAFGRLWDPSPAAGRETQPARRSLAGGQNRPDAAIRRSCRVGQGLQPTAGLGGQGGHGAGRAALSRRRRGVWRVAKLRTGHRAEPRYRVPAECYACRGTL